MRSFTEFADASRNRRVGRFGVRRGAPRWIGGTVLSAALLLAYAGDVLAEEAGGGAESGEELAGDEVAGDEVAGDEESATARDEAPSGELVVGVRYVDPFVMAADEGRHGIAYTLWSSISDRLGLDYRTEERSLEGLFEGLEDGSLDVAVAALTITAEREERVDFTHSYFLAGTGIAVSHDEVSPLFSVIRSLVSADFLLVLLALAGILFVTGALAWSFERRKNPEEFEPDAKRGLFSGFWWSAVTMTTVGYGDKTPRSAGGKLLALVWMFSGIIVVSFFTASITSSLTVGQLSGVVEGPADLPHARVGVLAGSATAGVLDDRFISYRSYESVEDGLEDVQGGELDAFVHDAPILRYLARQEFAGRVNVLPETFNDQHYGFALRAGSPLREDLNPVLLSELESERWNLLLERYLGVEE